MHPTTRYLSVLCASAPLLTACSGSSGSGTEQQANFTLAITDAASDELSSFVVDVTAVSVTRSDGRRFTVLTERKRVDLVTLQSTSSILNTIRVPPGRYESAGITFDFTNAEAHLRESNVPATLLDGDGAPLSGEVELPFAIGVNGLALVGGRHRMLEVDFDMDHSVVVDTPTNTVFVEPAIAVRVDGASKKLLIGAGELQSIDPVERTFLAENRNTELRPFPHVEVGVTPRTVYQIDGLPYVGAAGFAVLESLPMGTWVQGWGDVDEEYGRLIAYYVEAGRGTYGGGDDILTGHVTGIVQAPGGRTILNVLGHSEDASHESKLYNRTFSVTTDLAGTNVLVRGGPKLLGADRLNVGQRLRVFGDLNGLAMEASAGVVRLQPTAVYGIANGPPQDGILEIDLIRVGLRPESKFLWSEGGPTPANPRALTLRVRDSVSELGIAQGTAIEARGLFTAYANGGYDFLAQAVTDLDESAPLVLVHDRQGGQSVQAWSTATSIQLNLTGTMRVGELAHVIKPLRGSQPLPQVPSLRTVPYGPDGSGTFTLRDRTTGEVSVFPDFVSFSDALALVLAQGAVVYNFGAVGPYDAPSNTVSALRLLVTVE